MEVSEDLLITTTQVLKQKIEFVTLISHIYKDQDNSDTMVQYFICLGELYFYFIDTDFSKIKAQIKYSHIERLIWDQFNKKLFQLEFSVKRDKKVPAKMKIIAEDRITLINYIKYAWKTDYINNKLEVRDLPEYKNKIKIDEDIIDQRESIPKMLKYDQQLGFQMYLQDLLSEVKQSQILRLVQEELNSYKFYIPDNYVKELAKGVYFDVNSSENDYEKKSKITVQITKPESLLVLNNMGSQVSLKYYCEWYIQKIQEKQKNQNLLLVSSKNYCKRESLKIDNSEWSGWEIQVRQQSPLRDIFVIILRRKYMLPVYENFQDFIITQYSPIIPVDKIDKHLKKELKGKNIHKQYTRIVADTLQFNLPEQQPYNNCIKMKMNSLLYTGQEYQFFQSSIQIDNNYVYPDFVQIAIILIDFIYQKSSSQLQQFLKIKRIPINKQYQQKAQEIIQYGKNQVQQINAGFNEMENLIKELVQMVEDDKLRKIIKQYKDKLNDDEDEILSIDEIIKVWRYKFANYMAYLIDGGLYGGAFNVQLIVSEIQNSKDRNKKEQYYTLLNYLLYLTSEAQEFNITHSISKKIQNMEGNFSGYIYNQQILINLIQSDFFAIYFLQGDDQNSDAYLYFMERLLIENQVQEIKVAIFNHIIQFIRKQQEQKLMIDIIMKSMVKLVTPLMQIYTQSKDQTLKLLTLVSLVNLTGYYQQAEYQVMKGHNHQLILYNIDIQHVMDQQIIQYTLDFISNLIHLPQHKQLFYNDNLLQMLFKILDGIHFKRNKKIIVWGYYDTKVISKALEILRIFIQEKEYGQEYIISKIPIILQFINPQDEYFDDEDIKYQSIALLFRAWIIDTQSIVSILIDQEYDDVTNLCIPVYIRLLITNTGIQGPLLTICLQIYFLFISEQSLFYQDDFGNNKNFGDLEIQHVQSYFQQMLVTENLGLTEQDVKSCKKIIAQFKFQSQDKL